MTGRAVHRWLAGLVFWAGLAVSTPASSQGLTAEQLALRDHQGRLDAVTERLFTGAVAERCQRRPLAWLALLLRKSRADYQREEAAFRERHPDIGPRPDTSSAGFAALFLGQRLVERMGDAPCGTIASPVVLDEIDRHLYRPD